MHSVMRTYRKSPTGASFTCHFVLFVFSCLSEVTAVGRVRPGQKAEKKHLLRQQVVSQLFICKLVLLQALLGPGLGSLRLGPQRVHVRRICAGQEVKSQV